MKNIKKSEKPLSNEKGGPNNNGRHIDYKTQKNHAIKLLTTADKLTLEFLHPTQKV